MAFVWHICPSCISAEQLGAFFGLLQLKCSSTFRVWVFIYFLYCPLNSTVSFHKAINPLLHSTFRWERVCASSCSMFVSRPDAEQELNLKINIDSFWVYRLFLRRFWVVNFMIACCVICKWGTSSVQFGFIRKQRKKMRMKARIKSKETAINKLADSLESSQMAAVRDALVWWD